MNLSTNFELEQPVPHTKCRESGARRTERSELTTKGSNIAKFRYINKYPHDENK